MIYSIKMADGTASVGNQVVYTVPSDGNTYIVRCASLFNAGTPSGGAFIYVGGKGGLCVASASSGRVLVIDDQRYVLEAGDQIEVFADVASWGYQVTGYRLE